MRKALPASAFIVVTSAAFFVLAASLSAETVNVTPETLPAALEKANPGDTLVLADGVYKGGVFMKRSGTADAPILIKAAGKSAVFDGGDTCLQLEGANWVTVEGIRFQNASTAGMKVRMGDLPEAEHLTIRNCTFADNQKWGIITSHVRYFTIENCESFGAKIEHGIYVANSGDYPVVRSNRVHDNAGNGLHMNGDPEMGGDGIISNAVVEGNVIYSNGARGGSGVNLTHVQDSLFRNNLLYNNLAGGFTLYYDTGGDSHASKRNQVYNNTVYFRPGEGKLCLVFRKAATGCTAKNNVFFGGKRGTICAEPSCFDGLAMDNNVIANHPGQRLIGDSQEENAAALAPDYAKLGLIVDSADGLIIPVSAWQKKGLDVHSSFGVAPTFVDIGKADFHLAPGSVGIGQGANLLALVPNDIDGAPRPKDGPWDAGCFQSKP
jgi:hypothetical protein